MKRGDPMPRKARGSALLIGLIMLLVLTVFALTSLQVTRNSTVMVSNMQNRDAVTAAAASLMEETVSTTRLFESPNAIVLNPCSGANTKCYDFNQDGKPDVTVALSPTPRCIVANPIKNAALDVTDPNDAGCVVGTTGGSGVMGANTGDSLCADSLWDVTSVATDTLTGATMTVNAGYAVRVSTANVAASCP